MAATGSDEGLKCWGGGVGCSFVDHLSPPSVDCSGAEAFFPVDAGLTVFLVCAGHPDLM